MSVSVVLGNAPAYAGGASFALFLVLLAWASAIDLRERRIPNKLVAAMAVLWLAVRVLLAAMAAACSAGAFGSGAQIGDAALVASAAMMRIIPLGLTLGDGLVGALVLGGGSLAASIAFECLAQRPSMGGGDVKLLAVVGLFLGWERGLWCLFAACLVVLVMQMASRFREGGKGIASQPFPFAPAILVGVVIASIL
ncbi:prepilin peptidase [Ellagibacter isourolithinifaciens]|uniref:prepilin peptidase n=1 Tax=Ellagibacter isourolithinifaciens TaxID=2137581 RepID=UPI003AB0A457